VRMRVLAMAASASMPKKRIPWWALSVVTLALLASSWFLKPSSDWPAHQPSLVQQSHVPATTSFEAQPPAPVPDVAHAAVAPPPVEAPSPPQRARVRRARVLSTARPAAPSTEGRVEEREENSASSPHAASTHRVEQPEVVDVAAATEDHPVTQREELALPVQTERSATVSARDDGETLHREVALLDRARRALAAGDWADAEVALDAHQRQYPVGQLHKQRIALMARARCLASDLPAARRLHAQLKLLMAGTALLQSLERACPRLVLQP